MNETEKSSIQMRKAVIRFSGDSGDGIQLTGHLFSDTTAIAGNDLTTIPDYPPEIRAPQGSLYGVSSFQIQLGETEIYTPGDQIDVLIAMNPSALKTNIDHLKSGGVVIADNDNFNNKMLKKAGYEEDPLENGILKGIHSIKAPITSLTKECLKDLGLDMKSMVRCKNMFALGIVYWLFSRPLDNTLEVIDEKFKSKPQVSEANRRALNAGFNYAESNELLGPSIVIPPAELEKGTYRNINGNTATAWGAVAAAEKAGTSLSYCSYPITPATEILQEISKRKDLGVKVFQAEDEICAVCAAIGASYAGDLGVTATSGPGVSLKTEGIGLAVMAEVPLVVINVQRAGPSTGLPTKPEQADLGQALFGRHGEAPLIVIAASSPDDCFFYTYQAAKLAIEHSTPVMLMTDAYLASGSHPWKLPESEDLPEIKKPRYNHAETHGRWQPYMRDPETLVRYWHNPGEKGFEHRIGGLEKEEITGNISYGQLNHQKMVKTRQAKIDKVAKNIPKQQVIGNNKGDLLITGWGSTYGSLKTAVKELLDEGYENIGYTHFNYVAPLPSNTGKILNNYREVLVFEVNNGQFINYLQSQFPDIPFKGYNQLQCRPFFVSEIKETILKILK